MVTMDRSVTCTLVMDSPIIHQVHAVVVETVQNPINAPARTITLVMFVKPRHVTVSGVMIPLRFVLEREVASSITSVIVRRGILE